MRMRAAGAMGCAFLQSWRPGWAPWAGAVPASRGGGLAADGAGLGFLCAEALGCTGEPFPAHSDHPHWPHGLHMTKHWCIQDIHPPLLWAASLKYKPVYRCTPAHLFDSSYASSSCFCSGPGLCWWNSFQVFTRVPDLSPLCSVESQAAALRNNGTIM